MSLLTGSSLLRKCFFSQGGLNKSSFSIKDIPSSMGTCINRSFNTRPLLHLDRLTFSFSRSSGPGGQNVNKGNWRGRSNTLKATSLI